MIFKPAWKEITTCFCPWPYLQNSNEYVILHLHLKRSLKSLWKMGRPSPSHFLPSYFWFRRTHNQPCFDNPPLISPFQGVAMVLSGLVWKRPNTRRLPRTRPVWPVQNGPGSVWVQSRLRCEDVWNKINPPGGVDDSFLRLFFPGTSGTKTHKHSLAVLPIQSDSHRSKGSRTRERLIVGHFFAIFLYKIWTRDQHFSPETQVNYWRSVFSVAASW